MADKTEQRLFDAWKAANKAYLDHPGTREGKTRERLWQAHCEAYSALVRYQKGQGQVH